MCSCLMNMESNLQWSICSFRVSVLIEEPELSKHLYNDELGSSSLEGIKSKELSADCGSWTCVKLFMIKLAMDCLKPGALCATNAHEVSANAEKLRCC